jgi:hypothetical protein
MMPIASCMLSISPLPVTSTRLGFKSFETSKMEGQGDGLGSPGRPWVNVSFGFL